MSVQHRTHSYESGWPHTHEQLTEQGWELAAEFGVDSAAVVIGDVTFVDKDYAHKALQAAWKAQGEGDPEPVVQADDSGESVAMASGDGDGIYPVYVQRHQSGRIQAVMVMFNFDPEFWDENGRERTGTQELG